MTPLEAAIVRGVQAEVAQRGGWLVKTTGVAVAGVPDLVGSYRGRALAWEVKRPGQQPRPNQARQLELAGAAGADARVVRSRGEARAALDAIDEPMEDALLRQAHGRTTMHPAAPRVVKGGRP